MFPFTLYWGIKFLKFSPAGIWSAKALMLELWTVRGRRLWTSLRRNQWRNFYKMRLTDKVQYVVHPPTPCGMRRNFSLLSLEKCAVGKYLYHLVKYDLLHLTLWLVYWTMCEWIWILLYDWIALEQFELKLINAFMTFVVNGAISKHRTESKRKYECIDIWN